MFYQAGIVHSDLKAENILVNYDVNEDVAPVLSFKIIDFGSAFSFGKVDTDLELTTPEYLAPELLEYIENK